MNNLRQRLQKMSKEWLVNQLLEMSRADDLNTDRILLSLAADGDTAKSCAARFRKQLDKTIEQIVDHGPATWDAPLPSDGLDIVADALAVMLPKNLEVIIETAEYALVKLDSVFELQDECELEDVADDFSHLHLEACTLLKPDPCVLGERMAKLANETEWGFFDGPPSGYTEVLGEEGLRAYESKKSLTKA